MPAPSLTTITGTIYDENGAPAPNVTLYLKRVLLNGVLIGTAPIGSVSFPSLSGGDQTVFYIEAITSNASGVVSFTVPQLSTIYLEGNVSGYNNGEVALSIPATATSTLESLTPATFPIDVTTFTFLSLVDTPNDFTGDALKVARVNAAETAIEFATISVSVTAEEVQDALVNFFPDVAPFDWTYDDAGDRVTLAILDATAAARGLMSTAYAARLDALQTDDVVAFAGMDLTGNLRLLSDAGQILMGVNSDLALVWDAADKLALRRTTNAQTFRGYASFTDASNYTRFALSAAAGAPGNVTLAAESAGTGSANVDINLTPKGTGVVRIMTNALMWAVGGSTLFGNATTGVIGGAFRLVGWGSTTTLNFGGDTASFPTLKRNSATLEVRLANDSDDAILKAKHKVHANAVAETPTATHTIRLFDAAGTEYKVLCVAA